MNLDQFTKNGKYLMLAFDHRGSFKKLINPEKPEDVPDEMAIDLKREIINAVKDQISGVLIDEDYGLPAYPDHTKPYLLPVEKTGYTDQSGERVTELEYDVAHLKASGASGAKLLLYFNPHYETFSKQIETALSVQKDCQKNDFPFFLEVVVYEKEGGDLKADRPELVIKSLNELINGGVRPAVWKLEYPGNKDACELITQTVNITPWILLTRGDTYEVFIQELREAVSVGCTGFLAGRALWQEVCQLSGEEKEKFLKETLPVRFETISKIVL